MILTTKGGSVEVVKVIEKDKNLIVYKFIRWAESLDLQSNFCILDRCSSFIGKHLVHDKNKHIDAVDIKDIGKFISTDFF